MADTNCVRKRLAWFGLICGHTDDIVKKAVKKAMKENFTEKRGRPGRPSKRSKRSKVSKRWSGFIKKDTSLPIATSERYAKDRIKWKRLINTKWRKGSSGGVLKK